MRKIDEKILTFSIDPYQGSLFLTQLDPPKGYKFYKLFRKGKKVKLIYRKDGS